MVLVIIVVVAWIVILGPNLLKRHARSGDGISSISHFQHQLRVLEHSGPQPIVTPAYRLRSLDGSSEAMGTPDARGIRPVPVLTVVGATELPRAALAFLGEDPVEASSDQPERYRPRPGLYRQGGERFPGSRVDASGLPVLSGDSPSRHLARRRRRDTLGILAVVFVGSGLIGFVPGAGALWTVTAVSGLALVAYVALLVHLRRMAEERERKLHYLKPRAGGDQEPGGAVRPSVYMSGRYAHPSNQAAVAH